jgi:hypothetical protein
VIDFVVGLVPWAHPILGGVTIVLAFRAAGFALASRSGGVAGAQARARHRALAPVALVLVVASWLLGTWTVWARRPKLVVGESGHFTVGSVVVGLLAVSFLLSRRMPRDHWARLVHPWVGAVALILLGVQVFLGLQIMP